VALTGYGDPDTRERAEEAGFDLNLVNWSIPTISAN